MAASNWKNVSKALPCPLCDHTDWCSVSDDGNAVVCSRTEFTPNGWKLIKASKDNRNIYAKDDSEGIVRRTKQPSSKPKKPLKLKAIPSGKLTLLKLPKPATDLPKPKPKHDDKLNRRVLETEYWYSDSQWVLRKEWENPGNPKGREKTFRQWHYFTDENGHEKEKLGKGDQPWSAYRLNEALELIFQITDVAVLLLVEGEKCVEALRAIGLAAITFQGSSWGKDSEAVIQQLAKTGNLVLALLPDHDAEGQRKVTKISEQCDRAGLARIIIDPKKIYPALAEKQDCVDMVEAMGHDEFISKLEAEIITASQVNASAELPLEATSDDDFLVADDEKLTPTQKAWIRLQEIYDGRIRWNEMTLRCEIDGKPAKNLESLYLDLELDYNIKVSKEKVYDLVIRLARLHTYHPVREYLDRVAAKVEPINIDNLATRFLKTTLPIYDAMVKAHLIGSVKRILEPGCKKDEALILQGKQGIGKSTFFTKLYGREFFSDSLKGTDRDNLLILHQYWCLEVAEIESITSKKEVGELKAFITSQEDTFRPPYGKSSEPHERQSILVGTVNPEVFLQDETGNRRFWVIPVQYRIDTAEIEKFRDAIWSGVVAAYRNNESSILTYDQESLVNELNMNYVHEDSWKAKIEDYLVGREQVTCGELLEKALFFDVPKMGKPAEMRVGNILRQLGWRKSQGSYMGKNLKFWYLPTLPTSDTTQNRWVNHTEQGSYPPYPPFSQKLENNNFESDTDVNSFTATVNEFENITNQNDKKESFAVEVGKVDKMQTEQGLPTSQEGSLEVGKVGKFLCSCTNWEELKTALESFTYSDRIEAIKSLPSGEQRYIFDLIPSSLKVKGGQNLLIRTICQIFPEPVEPKKYPANEPDPEIEKLFPFGCRVRKTFDDGDTTEGIVFRHKPPNRLMFKWNQVDQQGKEYESVDSANLSQLERID